MHACGEIIRAMQITAEQQNRIDALCQRYRVRRLRMFGSTATGEDRPDSDIDLLVEFVPGQAPSAFAVVDLQDELSEVFNGRVIDLAFHSVLNNPYRRRAIEPQLRALYPARGLAA
jgi:uncharacterized protein